MITSLIAAISSNNVIGRNNQMIWHIPKDLKYFKNITMGHHIIMGRKNFNSINRPLPGRTNVIITRQQNYKIQDCIVVHSLQEGIDLARENGDNEAMIVGGGEIYELAMPLVDKMYITKIHEKFEGDTFFPEIREDQWVEVSHDDHYKDENNPFDFSFIVYKKQH